MSLNIKDGEFILIDKELNWTSFDVVNKIRQSIKKKLNIKKIKVGHAGTLDPLATGLLIICYGKMTKSIDNFSAMKKVYDGKMIIGSTTPSFDLETKPNINYPVNHIDEKLLLKTSKKFIGEILQKPPMYSAIKKNGVRLYKLAREGKKINREKRKVIIEKFEITSIKFPEVSFSVTCSKGTYIRSLVDDYGKELLSGAHLTWLRRTNIGDFSVNNSVKVMEFIHKI